MDIPLLKVLRLQDFWAKSSVKFVSSIWKNWKFACFRPKIEKNVKIKKTPFFLNLDKNLGLYGKDDLEAAFLDSIADDEKDFYNEVMPYYLACGYGNGDKV